MEKIRAVTEAVCELVAALCALSVWTTEHCYLPVRRNHQRDNSIEELTSKPFSICSGLSEAPEDASFVPSA